MFFTPLQLNKFMRENGVINEIYEAMESDDYADVVMAAINSLEKGNLKLCVKRETKCEKKSDNYRNDGNLAFKEANVLLAMYHYNKALRYAPNKSRAMLLAYSNRSALLFMTEHFAECLTDIETCFRLGCPFDIVDKLNKRKESATAKLAHKSNKFGILASYKKFFQIDNRSDEVPCASADVEIVVKDGAAKITAANNIKVGTVLAAESCFVGCNDYKLTSMGTLCRNCFGKSYNAIPCDGCCFIMFCSEKCKRKCQQGYHNVECQIMEVTEATDFRPRTMLMVAGALKFVQMCGTWKGAILESHCTGSKRRRVSKASQMFDADNKLSVLSYEENNIFVHGVMYENSFICAKIIDSLDRLPSYFPRPPRERALAKRALARIMMYLALYAKPTQVVLFEQSSSSVTILHGVKQMYYGLYPFIGKLQNSCTPNTIVSHAGNKYVLIALQPITKGSELTVSHIEHGAAEVRSDCAHVPTIRRCAEPPYFIHLLKNLVENYKQSDWGHYLDNEIVPHEKNLESYIMYGRVCKCIICTGEWRTRCDILNEEQLAAFKKYQSQVIQSFDAPLQSFSIICEVLACLSSAPFSKEYIEVYNDFRGRITYHNFINKPPRMENLC